MKCFKERLEIFIFAALIVSGLVSCVATPDTHEKWASYCLKQTDEKFRACLDKWNAWEKSDKR